MKINGLNKLNIIDDLNFIISSFNIIDDIKLKNFDIFRILYLDYLSIKRKRYYDLYLRIIKEVFFTKHNLFYINKNSNFVFFNLSSYETRKDHKSYYEEIKKLFINNSNIYLSTSMKLIFDFKLIGKLISYFFKLNKFKISKLIAIYLFCRFYHYEMVLLNLDSLNVQNYKFLFTFCDTDGFSNLITQFFKKKGVKSITLEHSQYIYKENSFDDISQLVFHNFSSDYILLNSEFSRTQFINAGINEKHLLNFGNFRTKIQRSKMNFNSTRFSNFLVILDSPVVKNSDNENIELILIANHIAKALDQKFEIKPHPSMKKSKKIFSHIDKNYCNKILDKSVKLSSLYNYSFSIFHNSGGFVDNLSNGIISFQYSKNNESYYGLEKNYIFSNIFEFKIVLNNWNSHKDQEKFKIMHNIIDFYLKKPDRNNFIKFVNAIE